MKSSWVIHLVPIKKKITVEMYNCYFGENMKNKTIIFLTSLVHIFSHFELIILTWNLRSAFPAKMYELHVWIAQNSVFSIKENSPVPSQGLQDLSVYLATVLEILKSQFWFAVTYLRFFTAPNSTLILYIFSEVNVLGECKQKISMIWRETRVSWMLFGWACLAAPGCPEILREDCFELHA